MPTTRTIAATASPGRWQRPSQALVCRLDRLERESMTQRRLPSWVSRNLTCRLCASSERQQVAHAAARRGVSRGGGARTEADAGCYNAGVNEERHLSSATRCRPSVQHHVRLDAPLVTPVLAFREVTKGERPERLQIGCGPGEHLVGWIVDRYRASSVVPQRKFQVSSSWWMTRRRGSMPDMTNVETSDSPTVDAGPESVTTAG